MKKIILIASALSLIGCIEIQDAKQKHNEPDGVQEISYKIVGLPHPQRYQVQFFGLNSQTQIKKQGKKLMSADDVVDFAGPQSYQVLANGREQTVQVLIPKDEVIEGRQLLSSYNLENIFEKPAYEKKLKVEGRLFFRAGSVLVTNGVGVLIEAQSVMSEGAEVVTFTAGTKAMNLDNGRNGGLIHLKTNSVEGALHFQMRGEEGSVGGPAGHGRPISEWQNKGTNGGNSGQLVVEVADFEKAKITFDIIPGAGGIGQDLIYGGTLLKKSMGNGNPGQVQTPCKLVQNTCEELK